eukprot:CAMPEP_0201515354 /NCGR_PEP_ID=MMETSP0161_2-20130828/6945_1 /ASSEMBLY_ACC=CAM_ASM_000251 /TAXON_ID=180227 /ORGANISM="Neoparamoeba aestuarina, Strain SoJaBio B1-5/56/2" /LENGTH=347 /DNA_ID=CAMNT_0047912153 /DNA_START=22 /DNA_END=1065 /DNA_ORIENTATION=-
MANKKAHYFLVLVVAYVFYFLFSDQQLDESLLTKEPLEPWGDGVTFSKIRVDSTLELSVAQAGPEDAEKAVVFVHGFPDLMDSWKPHVKYFASRGFRAIAFDTRGNGGSQPSDDSFTIDTLTLDVVHLIDELKLRENGKEVFLVCHDWGAVPAWGVAVNYPDSISGLIAYSVPHPHLYMTYNLKRLPFSLRKIWYFLFWGGTTPVALWKSQRNEFGWFKNFIWGTATPGTFSVDEVNQLVDNMKQRGDNMFSWYRMGFWWMVEFVVPTDSPFGTLWSGPRPAQVPVLQLFGSRDAYISQEMAVPGVDPQYVPVGGGHSVMYYSSHWLPHEKPVETCREIDRWIHDSF